MSQNAIFVKDLCKDYDSFSLDHLSFSVPQGSIVGFVGENGAGKTTTLKSILGIVSSQGLVQVFGKDAREQELEIKEQIGVVFDENHFYECFKPKQVEAVMKRMYWNWDSGCFGRYLKEFKLPEQKTIKEYSRGMKMKLSIAAALAHHPKLLILDEATSGLDPIVREEILDIFLDFIQDEQHSILFSSHITSDLDKIADYVIFIHNGKIVLQQDKALLLDTYGLLKCGRQVFDGLPREEIVRYRQNDFGYEVLVDRTHRLFRAHPDWVIDPVSIEDIMLLLVRGKETR